MVEINNEKPYKPFKVAFTRLLILLKPNSNNIFSKSVVEKTEVTFRPIAIGLRSTSSNEQLS
jgi:hypothetical protein